MLLPSQKNSGHDLSCKWHILRHRLPFACLLFWLLFYLERSKTPPRYQTAPKSLFGWTRRKHCSHTIKECIFWSRISKTTLLPIFSSPRYHNVLLLSIRHKSQLQSAVIQDISLNYFDDFFGCGECRHPECSVSWMLVRRRLKSAVHDFTIVNEGADYSNLACNSVLISLGENHFIKKYFITASAL